MKPRNLLVAAIILAALSGVVWWSKRHPQAAETKSTTANTSTNLADIPDTNLLEIDLAKKGSPTIVLQRQNGKWSITAPEQLPADQDAVSSMTSALNPLSADSVVEENASNLNNYGLTSPSLVVTAKEKNNKSAEISFGEDVPAGSLVYARAGTSPKVYAVASSVRSSFDKSLNDLRDKRLLTFDSNKLTQVELDAHKTDLVFAKNNSNDWQIIKPKPYRADNFQVEDLVRKLGDAKMDLSGSQTSQAIDAAFTAGQPVATAKVTDTSGTQQLEVRKNKDDYYAKSSVVKGEYKISADVGKALDKSLDDFRNRKIFDFGFNDPNKVEFQQGSVDRAYIKSGQDWKLNGQTMDTANVQALIDKLRDLSASKFVDTGFTKPTFTFTVTWNDGKRTDQVSFDKQAKGYILKRGEASELYEVDSKSVDDILVAGNNIKPAAPAKK